MYDSGRFGTVDGSRDSALMPGRGDRAGALGARAKGWRLWLLAGALVAFAGYGGGVASDAEAACGQVFNAKTDFGARGDGVADDTDELQRALGAAAGTGPDCLETVLLPAGTYNVNQPLRMNSYSVLDGAGMGTTTIMTKPFGSNVDSAGSLLKLIWIKGATVQELHIDGNNSG